MISPSRSKRCAASCGIVVQRDRAGMSDAERVERVAQAERAQLLVGVGALDVEEALRAELLAGRDGRGRRSRRAAADAAGRR